MPVLQEQKTGHGGAAFIWSFFLATVFLSAFAPPGWCDQDSVFAVWVVRHSDEYTVEAPEIDLLFRHQRSQFCGEI